MKILFCGLKYECGQPQMGLSFEYKNFFEVLKNMPGVECDIFPIDNITDKTRQEDINLKLIQKVETTKPDLLFCFLFTHEIKIETIAYITINTKTKTFNWFADDHWRFPVFSKYYAPVFSAVSTTDSQAVKKYEKIGIKNIFKTQWAANPKIYFPPATSVRENHEISFVGKKYGNRPNYMAFLKSRNLPAEAYGSGWEKGRTSHEKMLEIFSDSKINLNFTESPYTQGKNLAKLFAKLFIKKEFGTYRANVFRIWPNLLSAFGAQRRQIKGRTFEVPACGGFLLTEDADNLRDYYIDGKEIVIFKGTRDLAEKCKYYLEHEKERSQIAQAGYERTLKEHTYEHRFLDIFKKMNLV